MNDYYYWGSLYHPAFYLLLAAVCMHGIFNMDRYDYRSKRNWVIGTPITIAVIDLAHTVFFGIVNIRIFFN